MVTIIETANRVFELTVNPGPAETPGRCDRTLCLRQLSGRPLSRRAWRRLARRVRRLLHNGGATGHVVDLVEGLAGRLRQAHGFFRWDIDFVTLIGLVAQLQLALRHPANVGQTANETRAAVEGVIDALGHSEPRLAEFLRLGFDPAHDDMLPNHPNDRT